MPRVKFTEEALADLQSIVAFTIENWDATQARRYIAGLRDFCNELAAMPGIGKDAGWLMPGVRAFPYKGHVIYYREARQGIVILAVVHKRQEPKLPPHS